jgi:Co/Zn/Cd efflux system component
MFQKLKPHLFALLSFVVISSLYFMPALKGKQIEAGDNIAYQGAAKEVIDYQKKGEVILWTGRVFSGLPVYQISYAPKSNLIGWLNLPFTFFPKEIEIMLTLMIGMYVCLLFFNFSGLIAALMAIGYGFSTWFLLSIEAGHNSKMFAIGFLPILIGSLYNLYYSEKKWGLPFIGIAVALMINTAHFQIVLYGVIISIVMGIFILVDYIQQNRMGDFIKNTAMALVIAILGALCNVVSLWTNYEYAQETMRGGKSELTANKVATANGGLDIEYAFRWSYGISETFNLLFPDYMGGSSGYNIKSSRVEMGKGSGQDYVQLPLYWGDQPFTSGPTYLGVIILFLFVLNFFFDKSRMKWMLAIIAMTGLVLAWGRHFMILNEFLFNHLPMYNKFRTPSMSLTITTVAVIIGAASALKGLMSDEISKEDKLAILKKVAYIFGGIFILGYIMGTGASFTGPGDEQIRKSYPDFPLDQIFTDRKSIMTSDIYRAFFLALIAAGLVWAYLKDMYKNLTHIVLALGILSIFDLWSVGRRYVNDQDYKDVTKTEDFIQPTQADMQIAQDKSLHYRTINTTVDVFNSNEPGYFHNNVGGYSAAKLFRYQDLIENQIGKGNQAVLNMLNTKYFIQGAGQNQPPMAQQNPGACGHAWFTPSVVWAKNADDEMKAMDNFNPLQSVIIDERFKADVNATFRVDSTSVAPMGKIELSKYHPDKMTYAVTGNTATQFAVFSEIWYKGNKDWKAYIDGKEAKMVRCDYLLRGLNVPIGAKEIVFEFRPDSYYKGNMIGYAASLILIALLGFLFYKNKDEILKA